MPKQPSHSSITDVQMCKGTMIQDHVNLYKCKIGKNCKIQAFVFIPEGVTVEDEVFIGPHVCFINDKFPRATVAGRLREETDWRLEETFVQKGASIGANATILCGVTIGKNAMIAAGSFVTKDVAADTLVAGNPARFVRKIGGPDIA